MSKWLDIRTAQRKDMLLAFQLRRRKIVKACCQLNMDVDSYNENFNKGEPIPLTLDFTNDVREYELGQGRMVKIRKRSFSNVLDVVSSTKKGEGKS